MTNATDKDEVGRSNRLGPIAEKPVETREKQASTPNDPTSGNVAKRAKSCLTDSVSGVAAGVGGHLIKHNYKAIEGVAYRFPVAPFGPCVYFLIHRGRIVYIGQSRCPLDRFASHVIKFAGLFDEIAFRRVPPEKLLATEQRLIRKHDPIINNLSADYYRAELAGKGEQWIRDRMCVPPVLERRAKRVGVAVPETKKFRLSLHPKSGEGDVAADPTVVPLPASSGEVRDA